jgi:iron complex outermembrane receptor protein
MNFFLVGLLLSLFAAPRELRASGLEATVKGLFFNSTTKVIIDEQTIRESKAPDLVSLLSTQANVSLFSNNFQPPQFFFRGGESSHLLVVVDEVPVYDVAWAQKTVNLSSFDINSVKRIEILKGGQTVLYGGQALAGVIKIYTRGVSALTESQGHTVVTTNLADHRALGALWENQKYQLSGRLLERRSQSPVEDSRVVYPQAQKNFQGLLAGENTYLSYTGKVFAFRDQNVNPTTVNVKGAQSLVDSDVERKDEQLGASLVLHTKDSARESSVTLFHQKGWRSFYSDPSSASVDARFASGVSGIIARTELLTLGDFSLRGGASHQTEDFYLDDSKATLSVRSRTAREFEELSAGFLQARAQLGRDAVLEMGSRWEKTSGFSEKPSYLLGLTFFEKTRLEWVSGFRPPSAAQRFGIFESPGLEPETSRSLSLSQGIPLGRQGEWSLTAFETVFDNYIETRSVGAGILQYQNTAKVRVLGIESTASYQIRQGFLVQAAYAYQEPWDVVRAESLRRRPLVSGTLRCLLTENSWSTVIEGTGVGERRDFFASQRYRFPGYFLLNMSLHWRPDLGQKNQRVSLRISNVMDTRPELSIDYFGEGRVALASWEWQL